MTNAQRPGVPTLNFVEARTHMGAWCIVSAPLVLGMDLTDEAELARVWPIISNEAAIAVNQAYYDGDAGRLVDRATTTVTLPLCHWSDEGCTIPSWLLLAKRVAPDSVAVLLMNNGGSAATLSLNLTAAGLDCAHGGGCSFTSIWGAAPAATSGTAVPIPALAPHDSVFLVATAAHGGISGAAPLCNCSLATFEAMCDAFDTPGDCHWCPHGKCLAKNVTCPPLDSAK